MKRETAIKAYEQDDSKSKQSPEEGGFWGSMKMLRKEMKEKPLKGMYISLIEVLSSKPFKLKKWKENKNNLIETTLANLLKEISAKINEQIFGNVQKCPRS